MKTIISLLVLTAFTNAFAETVVRAESPALATLNRSYSETTGNNGESVSGSFEIVPVISINSRSTVMQLDQATVFIDPVGEQNDYRRFGRPDIVVLTRAAPSHLSIDTMIGMLRRDTVVLAPQAVIDVLPLMISNNVITPFNAGTTQQADGINFRALGRSDAVPADAYFFERDRGDIGVLMEVEGEQIYF